MFDILVCYWVLLLDEDHVKKTFLNRRTPFLAKLKSQKCRFRQKIQKTKSNFWNCCRNFWQHDGDPLLPKCPTTKFREILYIIRKVIDVYFFMKKLTILKIPRIFDFEIFWKNFRSCVIHNFIMWYENYHDMIL